LLKDGVHKLSPDSAATSENEGLAKGTRIS